MSNRKPFDPADADETLTRVIDYGGRTYLLFPYIEATGSQPRFTSIQCLIKGPAATPQDFEHLATLIGKAAQQAEWFITFSTPWLLGSAEAQREAKERASAARKPNRG
jgi:hypothetical protein